ncbi:MEDS domain-containing protein [Rhizobium sp. BK376]|uniref:MEDS domain-containing protein n=1 Tax=Rhizobium sp. BK376 TaxID=2512149 RepID=UPI001053E1D3|nr:MEDS domain-containing protein [Rhizobium sp. BK376]TCR92920.1 DcmR-like sensory protein [Rhizobium sp. BK376]
MKSDAEPVRLAGFELRQRRHVCAFFNSDEEAYRVLLPFIADGFCCGHKAVHLLNPGERANHLERLSQAGINTQAAEQSGQLELSTNTDTYLSDGRFDQDRMIAVFTELASGNAEGPYPLSRIVCHMDWAADGRSHVADLIEFEARVNDVWSQHDDVVICVYDLAKFGGDTVVDVMRSHPLVVIGGILHENPFFVPPAQFLEEFRSRRAAGSPWTCSEVENDDGT